MPRFHIENFGCRATQADGAALERQFLDRGMDRAAADDADIVVLNTCTVTAGADKDARASIRHLQRVNPDCRILVTGCYAQRAPDELAALPGVSWVVGNSHKHQAAEIAASSFSSGGIIPGPTSPIADKTSDNQVSNSSEVFSILTEQLSGESEGLAFSQGAGEGAATPSPRTFAQGFVSVAQLLGEGTLRETSSQSSQERFFDSAQFGSAPFDSAQFDSNQFDSNQFNLARFPPARNIFVGDIFAHTELLAAPVFDAANERTRPNLKVQDGCDNRCSFCVIPYVRGHSRSLGRDRVIAEVRTLVEAGYREVVISGINLGQWGKDLAEEASDSRGRNAKVDVPAGNSKRLVGMIRAVLEETRLEKLRVSSVEPMDWSDELIELMAGSDRIAKHAHVPMQSGSDAVLRRMHRRYRPWHYREKILKIRSAMPPAAIGADVMVGFPGETVAEFEETRRMVEELPFTYLHVFTYSARPGTPAAGLTGQIPVKIARERNRELREIASKKRVLFMQSLVGRVVKAITLRSSKGGEEDFAEALTENYLKVKVYGCHHANRWLDVWVDGIEGELLTGRPFDYPVTRPEPTGETSLTGNPLRAYDN